MLLLFEFHNFSFLLDIIGNVFIRLYHVTSIRIRIIRIRIIVRSEREPDMEPPDRPKGAEFQHAQQLKGVLVT